MKVIIESGEEFAHLFVGYDEMPIEHMIQFALSPRELGDLVTAISEAFQDCGPDAGYSKTLQISP